MTMEDIFSQLLLSIEQPHWAFDALLDQASPNPDPGYYSACGSISPASSSDSGCFSPPSESWAAVDSVPKTTTKAPGRPRLAHGGRRSRCRNPGKKRQSASEREKLRMRDLAKALQHLRTFLPPSVAPAGQTLTKIETLRLAIRYISHLSEQLLQEPSQGGVTDCSPRLPPAQPSSHPSYQPSLLQQPDHLSPLLSSLNPSGDFSFADAPSECFWIPELSHTLSGN